METLIRKSLGLKAHTVVAVEEDETVPALIVHIERLGQRRLRCGECGRPAAEVAPTRRPARRWRDLAMREHVVELVYAPHRVWCRHCGLRVERVPWAMKWQRVTQALARAVAALARELAWAAVAAHFSAQLEDGRRGGRSHRALGARASTLGAIARSRD